LEERSGKRVLREGTKAARKIFVASIKAATPVGPTGNLKRAIGSRYKYYRRSTTDTAVIGPRIEGKWKGYHGHLIEQGTKDRIVKDWLGLKKKGLRRRGIWMNVGRMKAKPFMKPAVLSVIAQAGEAGLARVKAALEAEFKKVAHG